MPDKYTIDKFIQLVKDGYIIDYDGIGYFGDDTSESEITVRCDVAYLRRMKKKYTHVYWYNR